jgi:UDP-2,4-diacetamido-2,4,6-trideoxy-beta-L-altropyranose hydrolase
MKAVFRVDASSTIGGGHLARSLTLAAALRRQGFALEILTVAPAPQLLAAARELHATVRQVDPDDRLDVRVLCGALQHADLVVFDHYALGASHHDASRGPKRVVCVIDDNGGVVGGDVILNGNFFGREVAYATRDEALRLLGPSFALIRPEFLDARKQRVVRRVSGGRRRLLVTMGAADPTGQTEVAIAALRRLDDADVRVIVGGMNPRKDALRELVAGCASEGWEMLVGVPDISAHMLWCDVAVTAAGSTCLELACVGVASVAIPVVDNQRRVAAAVASADLMLTVPAIDESLVEVVDGLLNDPARAAAMETAQRACVDGLGAARAARALAGAVHNVATQ